jgi:hypothetical protein
MSCCWTTKTTSRKPLKALNRFAIAFIGFAVSTDLSACSPGLPKTVDEPRLEQSVASVIGDINTCVVLAEPKSGRIVWTYGLPNICRIKYPACTSDKLIDVKALAKATAKSGVPVTTGCQSVSWAAGRAGRGQLVYGAVMAGARALPGIEISRRMDEVFANAGL